MQVTIAHISDIHAGGSLFSADLAENMMKFLKEVKPNIVIVTGDLTDDGYLHEYKTAEKLLSRIPAEKIIAVPGNHDSRNMGYIIFEEIFGTRYPFARYNSKVADICIQGVDSSEPDIDDGHIGRLTYHLVKANLSNCKGIKIVALHHHLIPVPGTGRERNIPTDAGDFLQLLIEMKVNIVLSGHKHVPWMWNLNNMLVLHAGTATTLRLKAKTPPSFNLIDIYSDEISIKRVNVIDLKETTLYRGFIPIPQVTFT